MGRLEENMANVEKAKREAEEINSKSKGQSTGKKAVNDIAKDNGSKSERMSLRVYPEIKEQFLKINRVRGLSNNSALNMIMTDYVEKYQYLLERY